MFDYEASRYETHAITQFCRCFFTQDFCNSQVEHQKVLEEIKEIKANIKYIKKYGMASFTELQNKLIQAYEHQYRPNRPKFLFDEWSKICSGEISLMFVDGHLIFEEKPNTAYWAELKNCLRKEK